MQKTLKISFRKAKKICFPREQSRAIMTLLLQIKNIKYFFFSSLCQSSWPVLHFAYFIKKVHG